MTTASLQINDLFDDITAENARLLSELKLTNKCVNLLQNYRKLLLNLRDYCRCGPIVNNKDVIDILESEYKTVFPEENCDKTAKKVDKIDSNEDQILAIDLNEDSLDLDLIQETSEEKVIGNLYYPSLKLRGQTISRQTVEEKKILVISRTKKNVIESKTSNKLFKCSFKGCREGFNSFKHLNSHQLIHNKSLEWKQREDSRPEQSLSPIIIEQRRLHNEEERQRRLRGVQSVTKLVNEIPKLKAMSDEKGKNPPRREVLEEALRYISALEAKHKSLMYEYNEELSKNKSLIDIKRKKTSHTLKFVKSY